eukprot:gnl/TRDRNA2_/TRDRNA2_199720_c0_seq1.p1 gnl/TRDRNA2_/TRDRNA2_199720_c0~~gnl/TRDRNA2_/TRDRNA2_199720_c0_seq1.p1  ORF type:complete len:283 (-),score=38.39 gnl/TRDRNA2_/TRDRNA2_199720_c0_seq1:168-1016(-)
MHRGILIILIATGATGYQADDMAENFGSMDKMADKFVDRLSARVQRVSPLDHAELDSTMLGKHDHLAIRPQASQRLLLPFRSHPYSAPDDVASLCAAHQQEFVSWMPKAHQIRRTGAARSSKGAGEEVEVRSGNLRGQPVKSKLDEFRSLMSNLYGVAGVSHLYDLLVGDSTLLRMQSDGMAAFASLPPEGQALALLWGAMGPAVWLARPRDDRSVEPAVTDLALAAYGMVEVCCAWLTNHAYRPASDPTISALGVQALVGGCYSYLRFTGANQTRPMNMNE